MSLLQTNRPSWQGGFAQNAEEGAGPSHSCCSRRGRGICVSQPPSAIYGASYYILPLEQRPYSDKHELLKPSGTIGLKLGILGTVLFFIIFLYALRKVIPWLGRWGTARHWMDFHVIAGIIGSDRDRLPCLVQVSGDRGDCLLDHAGGRIERGHRALSLRADPSLAERCRTFTQRTAGRRTGSRRSTCSAQSIYSAGAAEPSVARAFEGTHSEASGPSAPLAR